MNGCAGTAGCDVADVRFVATNRLRLSRGELVKRHMRIASYQRGKNGTAGSGILSKRAVACIFVNLIMCDNVSLTVDQGDQEL